MEVIRRKAAAAVSRGAFRHSVFDIKSDIVDHYKFIWPETTSEKTELNLNLLVKYSTPVMNKNLFFDREN